MIDSLLIAAGIYLTLGAVRFLAGELTEREKEKQEQIEKEIETFRETYENYVPDLSEIEHTRDYKSAKAVVSLHLTEAAEEQLLIYGDLYKEYREIIKRINKALSSKDTFFTPLRKYSYELYLRQICEAKERCYTYQAYLKHYINDTRKRRSVVPFYMKLPADYPYVGKVIWIATSSIKSGSCHYVPSDDLSFDIPLNDIHSFEIQEDNIVPAMITDYKAGQFHASLEKGAFKAYELANTHLGFSATVKRIENRRVILAYNNLQGDFELSLYIDNLINPNRFPPVHSSKVVYPIKWRYDLASRDGVYPVDVSERKEDAGSSLEFDSFPICFSEEDYKVFEKYYNSNDLGKYNKEFLIGPLNQDEYSFADNTEIKLQWGDIPLFIMRLNEDADEKGNLQYRFVFDRMCQSDESTFSADDIYVPFDVGFLPYVEGVSKKTVQKHMGEERFEDSSVLIWDVFEEFRMQYQIKHNRNGMGYFFKWESITDQLIDVLEQGNSIKVNVEWIESEKRDMLFARVINHDEFCSFINSFAKKTDTILRREWKPDFFVKDDQDNRYEVKVIDSGRKILFNGRNVSQVFDKTIDSIELFAVNRPYAEYQQKNALKAFRTGQVVNPQIQVACLESSSLISSQDEEKSVSRLFNDLLANNENQKHTVESALKERNIYFVQGPPGTGKTTVIRELVEQELEHNEDMRILIVSQANVAVDNALSGLLVNHDCDIVRVGNSDKISADFQKYRIQRKCAEYLDDLNKREESFDSDLVAEWKRTLLIGDDDTAFSPALYELIVRNHRIIGTTCVGLSRKRIGLERTTFDLVIIDEAGKALAAELLIPLLRARKAVVIGDQCQLPPVINPILYDEEKIDLEERAVSENQLFKHSFFERLIDNAPQSNKVMLDTQYRMPAVIGNAISQLFYNGQLKNGESTTDKTPVFFSSCLNFINFDGNRNYKEIKNDHNQIINEAEANAVVALLKNIRATNSNCSIAVITPYKGQKWLICNQLLNYGINFKTERIAVDTVDSFQGSEADLVIFCCTRSEVPTLFFCDSRRINVALSRTKRELIILGKMKYLYKFDNGKSYLSKLADYICEFGNVIKSNELPVIKISKRKARYTEVVIPTEYIGLPSDFYAQSVLDSDVDSMIEEYYRNGDFLERMRVKMINDEYMLVSGFVQYHAVQELGITECTCSLV